MQENSSSKSKNKKKRVTPKLNFKVEEINLQSNVDLIGLTHVKLAAAKLAFSIVLCCIECWVDYLLNGLKPCRFSVSVI